MSAFPLRFTRAMIFALGCFACSSARMEPTNGSLTIFAREQGTPKTTGSSGGAPSHEKTVAAPVTAAAAGVAGWGASSAPDPATATGRRPCASLPDPAPLRTDRWIALSLHFEEGKLTLTEFRPVSLRKSDVSKRVMGRFAAELWIGCELIDRVRFDFPLIGTDSAKSDPRSPNFEAAGRFDTMVMVPESDRATRLELVDRATDQRQSLDWPLRKPSNPW